MTEFFAIRCALMRPTPPRFTFSVFPFTFLPMSAEPKSYNPLAIKAWSLLSAVIGLIVFGMLVLGPHLLKAGRSAWDLIRWLASPII
jgi:hypothetical protein